MPLSAGFLNVCLRSARNVYVYLVGFIFSATVDLCYVAKMWFSKTLVNKRCDAKLYWDLIICGKNYHFSSNLYNLDVFLTSKTVIQLLVLINLLSIY